ncbi:MAG: GSCFA domain-containing protein, partial [Muribaculaceae bacterium]|nr:GSCFA domain-containing protein [Muribaculaceae bacterium]
MELRTIIDIPRQRPFTISHDRGIVMLGSCFTDNIGQRLERDGFDVTYNPMGTLYNPASVSNALSLALSDPSERRLMTRKDADEKWHCLNFAARYLYDTREEMEADINAQLDSLAEKVRDCSTIFITLGTSYVFHLGDEGIVGNCHKFPAETFIRRRLSISEIVDEWGEILRMLLVRYPGMRVI